MRKVLLCILCLSFLTLCHAESALKEVKGEHFIVYHEPGYNSFAKEVISYAEDYYISIAKDLGYARYSEFWLWDERVKIYIYKDHPCFLKASRQPSWSHGVAYYRKKIIMSYFRGQGFLDSILPHEIAHLMFRDFVGFTGEIPLWLDEGVAQWAETQKRSLMKKRIKDAINERMILSLDDMVNSDVRHINKDDTVYIRYGRYEQEPTLLILTGENLINLYYLQSFALVGFLIEKYGTNKFTVFCRELRNGKSVERALKAAYPYSLKGLEDFEVKWKEYYEEGQ